MKTLDQLFSLDDTLVDALDYDFSVSEVHINTMEAFEEHLLNPFLEKRKLMFFRGERKNSLDRPLLPTILRNRSKLMACDEGFWDITSDFLLKFYQSQGEYFSLFSSVFGRAGKYHLYDLCAFSQHYLECSPFIDFTKSLYVALSFGLKGKREFQDDGLLYVLTINDEENYTQDIVTAECWLRDYHVRVYDSGKDASCKRNVERTSPEAKVIDIANNDRMKFQQGVFLMLDQFDLVNKMYLTKNVRSDVDIKKYILHREICPQLTELVERNSPWYSFSNLLDIGAGIQTAIGCRRSAL
ncbi:MAG: FRG domain-containing protein [Clostridia bacterium]|nr:FRG domain-containing protein [Clostridia bacterium]